MKTIIINKRQYSIPTSYNEAPVAAILVYIEMVYLKLGVLFAKDKKGNVSITEPIQYRKALILLLKNSLQKVAPANLFIRTFAHLHISSRLFFRINEYQIIALLKEKQLMSFYFDLNTLTKNPFPYFRVSQFSHSHILTFSHCLYGPADNFQSLTIEEYSWADIFYTRYKRFKEPEYLDKFIAVLYRPRSVSSQTGTSQNGAPGLFSLDTVDSRLELVAKIPFLHKMAIIFWFEGCSNAAAKRFKEVYTESNTNAAVEDHNWLNIILTLSGSKFGTYDQTKVQPFELVFTELNRQAIEAQRIKDQINQ